MKAQAAYHESSLLEKIAIGRFVAWIDACLVVTMARILGIIDRIVEKEAIREASFIASGFFGIAFILEAVSKKPELASQNETLRMCLILVILIVSLRFTCARVTKMTLALKSADSKRRMGKIQPARASSAIFALSLGGYEWYSFNYLYLALSITLAVAAIYIHAATAHLTIKARSIREEKTKELYSDK